MEAITNPWSPSSLQLRLSRRCSPTSRLSFKIRFRPLIRRVRLVTASGSGGNASSSPDAFSGGDPKKKKDGLGRMLGAGLAGVLFAAGVTYASLSLSSRTTSGAKQHLEPLTTKQQLSLSFDDEGEKVFEDGKESNVVVTDNGSKTIDHNSETGTGRNKDISSRIEIIEDATGSGLDNFHPSETMLIQTIKSNENGDTTTHGTSIQDDIQTSLDIERTLVPSSQNPSLTELSAFDAVKFPSDISSFKDSHSDMTSDSPDSFIGNGVKSTLDDVSLSSISTDSTVHTSDNRCDGFHHEGFPLDLVSKPIVESGDVDLQVSSREVFENAAVVLKDQNMEHTEMLDLPAESSSLDLEVQNIVQIVSSSTMSCSAFDQNEALTLSKESVTPIEGYTLDDSAQSIAYSDPNGNQPLISGHNTGRSTIPESVLPDDSVSYAGIPAPSLVSAALLATPGKVLVPAVIDQVQGQTLAALQVLKVIEADVQPGDLCTRREYARWLVTASSALSRSTISKIYPAMFIENVTELAFDDVTPEDPDFSFIQGLAEAGIISSNLSKSDLHGSSSEHDSFLFSPESPVSRQDLVSWKMALATRQLPEVDRKYLYELSGYIDIDKIDPNAWPALVADLSSGEQGITALAFGYTRLFQPNKPVTKAQAAIALATGDAADVVVEELTRIEAESLAETAVNAHAALVAQVEKDLNASYEKELSLEREKINAVEELAEEARVELERLRAEREEENNALIRRRSAVESEMEILSKLRWEVEDQLQDLMGSKLQIAFEKDTINKLQKEAESGNQVIVQLQYELEIERKALSMARSWAEEEAKNAREQARALEEARERWARHGIKVVVDSDLQDDASTGATWLNNAGKQPPVAEAINRAEKLVEKLRAMAAEIKLRSSAVLETIIQKIVAFISSLKQHSSEASMLAKEYHSSVVSSASRSIEDVKERASGFSSSIGDRAKRAVEDCKESVDRLSQKFKT